MNKSYRIVWSQVRQAYIVAHEKAAWGGRPGATLAAAAALLLGLISPGLAADLPTGGQIVAGSGSIALSGNTMTVTQSTDRLAANWQSFSIGQGYAVNFVQPSTSSIALNRVLGSDVSVIQGALRANGQVFLINPNGVLFSPTAQVEVGGLVASTLDLSNEDFLAGRLRLAGGSANAVINQGQINVSPGGTVALVAARIENTGRIDAPQGSVLMGAGQAVTLDLGGSVRIQVEEGALNALIEQGGAIQADGGLVYLTARAAGDLASAAINHTGITEAKTLATGERGEIWLMGDMARGVVNVGGTLDTSPLPSGEGVGARGGFIETSAARVKVQDGAQVKAGHWLIDPNDFTIAATGGDITGATLSASLASGDVTIQSASGATSGNGDIFVRDGVTWSSGNTLTLSAHRNIEILATLDASAGSGGKVALEYGQGATDGVIGGKEASYSFGLTGAGFTGRINLQAGNNFTTKLGSDGTPIDWTVITDLGTAGDTSTTTLQGMKNNLSGNYVLGADIDASGTANWNDDGSGNKQGFMPIGNDTNSFTGRFDGLGHTLSGLTIDRPSTDYVGLFGYTQSATLRNVGLEGGSVTGNNLVGGLVGYNYSGTITHSYATGAVTGSGDYVGGLVGENYNSSTITDSYATGAVSGAWYVGGLVGGNNSSTVQSSYATSAVTGSGDKVGGLVGGNDSSTVTDSYATGAVSGSSYVGGLAGSNNYSSTITHSYATGAVSGSSYVGGLAGSNRNYSTITHSYATGAVTGSGSYVGGLVGNNAYGTVTASFWDTQTTGQTTSAGGTGKTTAEMKQLATFAGWDIDDAGGTGAVWRIYDGQTYPLLRGFLAPLTLTPAFNGSGSYSNIAAYAETGVDAGKLLAGNATLKIASTSGGVAAQLSGYASTQQGYDIAYASHPLAGLGSGGNLRLDSPISWNSGTLRLVADGNIEILSTLDASGGGKVALEYGQGATDGVIGGKEASYSFGLTGAGFTGRINLQAGNNFTTKLGSDGTPIQWTVITSLGSAGDETSGPTNSLQGLAHSSRLSGHYVLGADIDASATSTWNSGAGFAPIGNTMGFTGRFDGLGHVITNLTINRPTTDYVGLFGHASGGVRNVGLDNGSVSGKNFVGGLVGRNYSGGTISNSYATGSVNGGSYLGGLVGNNYGGTISNSYATGGVTGSGNDAGGLVGNNYGGTISNSYATGSVTATGNVVGGLVGSNNSGTISNSYATGSVSGTSLVGGLVGYNSVIGTLQNSYATGNVTATGNSVGGLVGGNDGTVQNSYATGSVTTTGIVVGGLVGNNNSGTISNSYATGSVNGGTYLGGLVGRNSGTVTGSFWDTQTTGQATSAGGTGLTTAQMKSLATFDAAGWDIDDAGGTGTVWRLYDGDSYPLLRSFLTPLAIDAASPGDKVYDGNAVTSLPDGLFTISSAYDASKVLFGGSVNGKKNAGSHTAAIYSNQAGYDLVGTRSVAYAITPKTLTVSGITAANKTYDGTADATLTYGDGNFAGLVAGDAVTASGAFADKNAGNGKTVALTFGGTDAGNYSFTGQSSTTADITPRPVQVTADAKSKTQGQSDPPLTYATGCPTGMSTDCGLVGGETLAGSLSRDAGEAAGAYAIRQGTVTDGSNPNYTISYQGADLTIAAVGSGGGGSSGGSMSDAPGSALASAQRTAASIQPPSPQGMAAPLAPTAAQELVLVEVSSESLPRSDQDGGATHDGAAGNLAAILGDLGRDAAGFMRVIVVDGGINLGMHRAALSANEDKRKVD